jgi:CxxC motif-containing protein (DUF1111 family)
MRKASRRKCLCLIALFAALLTEVRCGGSLQAQGVHPSDRGGGQPPSGGGSSGGGGGGGSDHEGQPVDPGVRGGAPGAGGPLVGLSPDYQAFFAAALGKFLEVDSVTGGISGEAGVGLGPRFNLNSCAACHAQPTTGGTSPFTNPEVALATLDGATNFVPPFVTLDGPVREARFIRDSKGNPDGGVHDLFVISGRTDAPGCHIAQPDFNTALANQNVIFRIPTPVFGAGLIEALADSTILRNAANPNKGNFGVSGHANTSGNDGTITRFGWKAQNKSLLVFAGEAYNVEQGVTNELFTNERENDPNCQFNGTPEDSTNTTTTAANLPMGFSSDVVNFATFMRLSAPPTPARRTSSIGDGSQVFNAIGCNMCHTPALSTGRAYLPALSNQQANLFSDLLVHNMGTDLADGVSQGNAGGNQFRTAPLWGLGQRIFFLHDGRTKDLIEAIKAHRSDGSEANSVINNYLELSSRDQQDLLNFLRSL